MIVLLKMHASGKIFDRIRLQYMECNQGTGGLNFLVRVISNRREKVEHFGLLGDSLNSLL